ALPRGHELRERALRDDATRPVERDARRKVDAERLLGHVRTRGAKTVGKSGENGDAGTAAFDIATYPLENLHFPARAMKQIAGDQTDQRPTDDEHPAARTVHTGCHVSSASSALPVASPARCSASFTA